ncbi:MAG: hypothetical protein WCC17_03110 [Candidatus Nitrosopolaris sp.]
MVSTKPQSLQALNRICVSILVMAAKKKTGAKSSKKVKAGAKSKTR